MRSKRYCVYMLLCADGSVYVGVTGNLEERIRRHETGYYYGSYTSIRRPVKLIWYAMYHKMSYAIMMEKKIKKWSKAKKMALANGNMELFRKLSRGKNAPWYTPGMDRAPR